MTSGRWPITVVGVVASWISLTLGSRIGHAQMPGRLPPGPTGVPPWRRGDDLIPPWSVPTALTTLIVLAGLVVLRTRPRIGFTTVTVGLIGFGAAGGSAIGIIAPAAFAAAGLVRARGLAAASRWLPLLILAGWADWWDAPLFGLDDWQLYWSLVTGAVWVLLPAVVVALTQGRRESAARARADERRQVAAEERLRVARDIHDVVGHSLSMISLQSAVALRVMDADPEQARTSLTAIRTSSRQALAELRETLGIFRAGEDILAPTPDLTAIGGLVENVRAGGVQVRFTGIPDAAGVGAGVQTAAYRVVQEGLTNAVRHAPGRGVEVEVRRNDRTLWVRVTDEGTPTAHLTEGGGLRGMRERVESLGGTLSAAPTASGFVVEAMLPISGEQP